MPVQDKPGTITLPEAVKRYLASRRSALSGATYRDYYYGLRRFCRAIGKDTPIGKIDRATIQGYLNGLREAGSSAWRTNGYRLVSSAFCSCLADEGLIPANPVLRLPYQRAPASHQSPLSRADHRQVLNELFKLDALAGLTVQMAYESAARRWDLAHLEWPDFGFSQDGRCVLTFVSHKTQRHDSTPKCILLSLPLTALLTQYRNKLHADGRLTGYVLLPWHLDPNTGKTVQWATVGRWGQWVTEHLKAAHEAAGVPMDKKPLQAIREAALAHVAEQDIPPTENRLAGEAMHGINVDAWDCGSQGETERGPL